MHPIIYSAPFGNWIGDHSCVTPTLGTFTLKYRGGLPYRLWRMARTLRYSPLLRAWVNRLGLPNPGIDSILTTKKPSLLAGALVSLHGFSTDDWIALLDRFGSFLGIYGLQGLRGIELNLSCPNVADDPLDYTRVMKRALDLVRAPTAEQEAVPPVLIVKIPPVRWQVIVECAVQAGVHYLHCCNTLPVKRGGMSGKPLKPISLSVIEMICGRYPFDRPRLIGGGGITSLADIRDYRNAGAQHFAVGSALFNPLHCHRLHRLAKRIAHEGLDTVLKEA